MNATSIEAWPAAPILSMWYSRSRALELVRDYERRTGRDFHLVHIARHDTCPNVCHDGALRYERVAPAGGKLLNVRFFGAWTHHRHHLYVFPNRSYDPFGRRIPPFRYAHSVGTSGERHEPDGYPHPSPRYDDYDLLARSSVALARLAEAMVQNTANQSFNLRHFYDPHALLGIQIQRLFTAAEVDVLPTLPRSLIIRKAWPKGRRGVCRSLKATVGMGGGRDVFRCYNSTCGGPARKQACSLLE